MAPTSSADIIFYDIAPGPPVRPFAPNPWKARYALNFKRANYVTEWVDLSQVKATRKRLGVAPVRFFADGEPFYTLPVIRDTSTEPETLVGDSFDIALHVDRKYPNTPSLFRNGSVGLYAAFNAQIDGLFFHGVALCPAGFPFNPLTEAECKAEMCRRAGFERFEDFLLPAEGRRKVLAALESALGEVAKFYRFSPDADSPFMAGEDEPDYADIILGAWLMFCSQTVPEFGEIRTWHGGRWGRLHHGLAKYRATW
jgi:glutathione S-transferase